jgi:hypothetical protein
VCTFVCCIQSRAGIQLIFSKSYTHIYLRAGKKTLTFFRQGI